MTELQIPAEPIPFRILLDEAMKLTRRHFGKIYLPVAIPMAVLSGLLVLVQSRWTNQVMSGRTDPMAFWTGPGCTAFAITMLVFLIMTFLTYGLLMAAGVDGATGKPIDMKAKWSFLFSPGVFGTLFVAFLLVAIGFCFLFFPGLFIALRLSFLIPVMAVEGVRGGEAMKRSWGLVAYNPQKRFLTNTITKIFVLYFVAGVIGWLAAAVINLPFTALQGLNAARQITSGGTVDPQAMVDSMRWIQLPQTILASLVETAVRIYSSFGVVLLYLDVVRRKEGTDLASAIASRFGASPEPPPSTVAPA